MKKQQLNASFFTLKLLRKILLLATLLWQIPTLLSLSAYYISPAFHWLPVLFGMAFPIVLLVNFLLLLFWLWWHKKYALIPLFTLLIGWPQLSATLNFNLLDDKAENSEQQLRIISYNTREFDNWQSNNDFQDTKKCIQFIKKIKPDIFCLQESNNTNVRVFRYLKKEMGLQYSIETPYGTALFSRYPIVAKKIEKFDQTGNSFLYADITFNNKTIRVLNVHFQSHRLEEEDYDIIKNPNLEEKEQIRATLIKVAKSSRRRTKQAAIVQEIIEESPHPVILCGDFNDPPASYAYKQIASLLNDSFRAKGLGMGSSYAGPLPGLRIDYVMADDNFRCLSHAVKRYEFSDHYPVVVDLELKR